MSKTVEFPKEKLFKTIGEEFYDKMLDPTYRFVYPKGKYATDKETLHLYRAMIPKLTQLQREKKCIMSYDDPDIPYDAHQVIIRWAKGEVEVSAEDLLSIIQPLLNADADDTVTIENRGDWSFYVTIYSPIEGWDEYIISPTETTP